MTYTVSSGMLNSIYHTITILSEWHCMDLPTIEYSRTAGRTKAVLEWVFILWQLWSRLHSVHCSVHGLMLHLLKDNKHIYHGIGSCDFTRSFIAMVAITVSYSLSLWYDRHFYCPHGNMGNLPYILQLPLYYRVLHYDVTFYTSI